MKEAAMVNPSYLTTHKYVRYLLFGVVVSTAALVILWTLGNMFGYDNVWELGKALLGKQELIEMTEGTTQ